MLKNIFLFSLSLLMIISFSSCRKPLINNPIRENPNDILINIFVDVNLRSEAKYYLVVENTVSAPQYISISNYFVYAMKRGDLKGNTINLHFILIDEVVDNNTDIKSFYNVPLGRGIRITSDNLKNSKANFSTVNLSFTNIPEFEIINRTAKNPEQGFTQKTFETPITTQELGGETYQSNKLFYACFNNINNPAYKLVRIPSNISNYTIDFSDLNPDIKNFTFSKNLNSAIITHADIQAWNNPFMEGSYVEIFNLDNFDIFPTSTFDVVIPTYEVELRYFIQNFTFEKTDYTFNNWYYSTTLNDNITLLETGLKTTGRIGELPIIESNDNSYDEAQIIFEDENFHWTLYSNNTISFYIPEIPELISNLFPETKNLNQLFLNQENGKIKLIDYSSLENWNEVLDMHFGKIILDIESNFRTQEQIFSIK